MSRFAALVCLLLGTLSVAPGGASPKPAAAELNSGIEVPDSEQLARWIQQLDSDRFAERNEASRRLEEAGKAAFPALAEAALGTSREATLRALQILRRHSQEGSEASQQAARAALEKIASSDHAAARWAKEALSPPKPAERVPPLVPIVQGWPIGGQQVQVQIQMNVGGGNQQRRVQIKRGVKQTAVTEKDLKVKITDEPNGGVQLEVTRKKDGKETTDKYSAKSLEELKKAQPEAYRLYDKYVRPQDARIQIQAVPGGPPKIQVLPAQPR